MFRYGVTYVGIHKNNKSTGFVTGDTLTEPWVYNKMADVKFERDKW